MSVTSGFYNSVSGDRKYDAVQISSMFDGLINDGVFDNYGSGFSVSAIGGMSVSIGTGRAWFNHTWTLNDSSLILTLDDSEVTLDRIDAVVLDVDSRDTVRNNSIIIVKGTPASEPKYPEMIKSADHNQYPLAYIPVQAGLSELNDAGILSCVGTTKCPYVTASFYDAATTDKEGLMSSSDKKKLDGIAAGANKYTLPTASSSTLGGVKTSSTVTSSSGYTACPIISGVPYYKDTNTTYSTATSSANGLMSSSDKKKLDGIVTYSTATSSANGLMSSSDKKKLDGIAAGANKYTLPTASSSTLGGVKTSSTVTSSSGYTACPIISGVPYYKDTNTTYSTATSSANGLMSSSDKKKLDGIYSGATPVTIRTGIVPKYGATNDTISLSYLSGRTKALVMIYKDGTISNVNNTAFGSLHLTGISNSMRASSSAINGGSNTGCTVAISKAGVITLKPTSGATASQRYIVIYYN